MTKTLIKWYIEDDGGLPLTKLLIQWSDDFGSRDFNEFSKL